MAPLGSLCLSTDFDLDHWQGGKKLFAKRQDKSVSSSGTTKVLCSMSSTSSPSGRGKDTGESVQ